MRMSDLSSGVCSSDLEFYVKTLSHASRCYHNCEKPAESLEASFVIWKAAKRFYLLLHSFSKLFICKIQPLLNQLHQFVETVYWLLEQSEPFLACQLPGADQSGSSKLAQISR